MVVRDRLGGPQVIRNAPLLSDGTPMPTRYWLVGREVREAASRLEAAGGVRRFESRVDPAELAAAHERYAAERDAALPFGHRGPAPAGGVGGTRRGVKCLHAHLAWLLAGGDDPVGRLVAAELAGAPPVVALDCGTNSTRVLVAAPWPFGAAGGTVTLVREMRITRLGEGVDRSGRLADEAIERTVAVLAGYRCRYEPLGPAAVRAVATSALRDAANGDRFLERAEEVLGGIRPEVLGGEEEGRLSFAGATAELPAEAGPYLVMDVGGGSTELVAGGAGGVEAVVSLDVGCVRVSERWLRSDPPAPAELAGARSAVGELVEGAAQRWPALHRPATLVGLAGTVSALASVEQGLGGYDRSRLHHHRLSRATVERLVAELAAVPAPERRRRRGLEPERAGVVVGGGVVVAEVMGRLGHEELLTSESDILDGIAAGLLAAGAG